MGTFLLSLLYGVRLKSDPNRNVPKWTVGLSGVVLWCLMVAPEPAWAQLPVLSEDVDYAITYEVSVSETRTIKPGKVLGVKQLGSKDFLAVEFQGLGKKATGYIDLERIRAILPVNIGGGFSIERNLHRKILPVRKPYQAPSSND